MKCLVLLAGCGLGEGSAVEEVILMYLTLDKHDIDHVPAAENRNIPSVNHLTEEKSSDNRNILIEAARLGRGRIRDVAVITADDFDALLIPGGLGIRHFLDSQIIPGLVQAFYKQKKPIDAVCTVIDLLRKWLDPNLLKEEAKALPASAFCYDPVHQVYYSPAFRAGGNLAEIYQGIDGMIGAMAAKATGESI